MKADLPRSCKTFHTWDKIYIYLYFLPLQPQSSSGRLLGCVQWCSSRDTLSRSPQMSLPVKTQTLCYMTILLSVIYCIIILKSIFVLVVPELEPKGDYRFRILQNAESALTTPTILIYSSSCTGWLTCSGLSYTPRTSEKVSYICHNPGSWGEDQETRFTLHDWPA